ncbi:MAG TPA: reductase [Burkholderiaceae bacterium]|nr:reductase [Burkholderiaceae bacterium]
MKSERATRFGFASPEDVPIPYLARIREYYQALGYGTPYEWAHYAEVPFQPLRKPLAGSCVTIVTTAAPYRAEMGLLDRKGAYHAAAKFYSVYARGTDTDHDLRITHVAIDYKHTTADDAGTWFPLPQLRRAASAGRIGRIGPRFFGMPTNRSHRVTLQVDCPEVVAGCKTDGIDAVVLVPNCPVCHQTVSLAARMLEENGISTVVMGCAKDIVELIGVPRFLFSDFPLGNSAGRPRDPDSQADTLELALRLLESAPGPRTTLQSPLRWADNADWKRDYSNIDRLSPEEIERRRAAFDQAKAQARQVKEREQSARSDVDDPPRAKGKHGRQ